VVVEWWMDRFRERVVRELQRATVGISAPVRVPDEQGVAIVITTSGGVTSAPNILGGGG
jgi:hypothetical protein